MNENNVVTNNLGIDNTACKMQYLLIGKGGYKMNEVFEKLSDVFEELRSEADEREYSIQTEETKKADKELKKANREYEKFLSELSAEQRIFLENYMDIVYFKWYNIIMETEAL